VPSGTGDPARALALVGSEARRFPPGKLESYLRELLTFNARLGLVSKRTPEETAAKLVLQSLALLDFLREARPGFVVGGRVVDIGTGGGIPGLVWKLTEPRMKLCLIERASGKAAFLEQTVRLLGLEGVEVVEGDYKKIATEEGYEGAFDLAVAVAVEKPPKMARWVWRLLGPEGAFCTVRPTKEREFARSLPPGLELERVGQTGTARMLLYRKVPPGRSEGSEEPS